MFAVTASINGNAGRPAVALAKFSGYRESVILEMSVDQATRNG
jgi:hypothetical protein